ncbi:MAG: hypothetical protein K5657_00015 [Desulfovibrio sp.]|nr:hypothetical protein [Desulfovibrio sp.]
MTIREVHEKWLDCPFCDLESLINNHDLQAYRCVDNPPKPESSVLHIVKIEEELYCKVDPDEESMTWIDEKGQILYADIPECDPDCTYDGLYILKKDVVKIEQEYPHYVTSPSAEDKSFIIAKLELELERLQERIKELNLNADENKELDPNADKNTGLKTWRDEYPLCDRIIALHNRGYNEEEILKILMDRPFYFKKFVTIQ